MFDIKQMTDFRCKCDRHLYFSVDFFVLDTETNTLSCECGESEKLHILEIIQLSDLIKFGLLKTK